MLKSHKCITAMILGEWKEGVTGARQDGIREEWKVKVLEGKRRKDSEKR